MTFNIYAEIVKAKGETHQFLKAIEELGELTRAISRYVSGDKSDKSQVLDEMADCQIMLNQLAEIMGHSDVSKAFEAKLQHVKKRLEDGTL